jgi:hypothetical protein
VSGDRFGRRCARCGRPEFGIDQWGEPNTDAGIELFNVGDELVCPLCLRGAERDDPEPAHY